MNVTKGHQHMADTFDVPSVEQPITRLGRETSIALAWNAFGTQAGLSPVAWKLGEPGDGIHFTADADAYAPDLRCDIVEAWIAALGLADQFDLTDDPLRRAGTRMIWTGTIDGVTFQFHYPADITP
ncbi:hypothetical protein ACMA46_07925 [Clavibacter sp. Sh2141]|uniref:hypothetical protein n=1 Tax=Clavibacter sp. Sh2141 TaxID=3395374 RepID=UPI0039BD8A3D